MSFNSVRHNLWLTLGANGSGARASRSFGEFLTGRFSELRSYSLVECSDSPILEVYRWTSIQPTPKQILCVAKIARVL